MQNPNQAFKLFMLIFGVPFIVIALCLRPVLATEGPVQAAEQFKLAVQYHTGQNLQQNSEQAIHWYEQAAQQGHPKAQVNLGVILCEGYATPKEFERGLHWLQKAAEQGEINAQYKIGCLYLEGTKLSKDLTLARHWLKKAADAGHADAQMMFNLCASDNP
jgi:TPR repeat protein